MDKSLDEIIRSKKSARGRGGLRRGGRGRGTRGGAGGRGGRGGGGGGGGGFKKAFSRQTTDQVQGKWQHDMFQSPTGRGGGRGGGGGGAGVQKSTKLMISNLDYGVSTDDIRELFSEFGRVTKADVHFDKSGRSLGTATVLYTRYVDAKKAFEQYNNVPLDGRPMTVQIVSDQLRQQTAMNGSGGGTVKQRVGAKQQTTGGGDAPKRGGRGRGRGGRGARAPPPTLEELDADLDAYKQAESMES